MCVPMRAGLRVPGGRGEGPPDDGGADAHGYAWFLKEQSLSEASVPRVVFDAVAPQLLRFLSVLRGANAWAGEAFALRGTSLWT